MAKKYVFSFHEGDSKNKMLLGGKGAGLCALTQNGFNVPEGIIITTEACLEYLASKSTGLPKSLKKEIDLGMSEMERRTGAIFGSADCPLLTSVRSGAAESMPGMMSTVLDAQINDERNNKLIEVTNNPRFGWDAYRRFIQLFGTISLDIPNEKFEEIFNEIKSRYSEDDAIEWYAEKGLLLPKDKKIPDLMLTARDLEEATHRFKEVVLKHTGKPLPSDPQEQIEVSVEGVFRSWIGKTARDYRKDHHITKDKANGTAVNIVRMVFGNMGDDCATGVGFTRDAGTGENVMYGEYLINAQGEDVVAGIRTPEPISKMKTEWPEMYRQIVGLRDKLEATFHEVQDYEYTVEKGVLYILQIRKGKMNAVADVRTSIEMEKEKFFDRKAAILRVEPNSLEQLFNPQIDKSYKGKPAAIGKKSSPGAACGQIVFDAADVGKWTKKGAKVILARPKTKPEDVYGFKPAEGILTSEGGETSHAALIARGMGKPCVVGADEININVKAKTATINKQVIHEGDFITIDGGNGNVYVGEIPLVKPTGQTEELKTLLSWADEFAVLKVRANADTPDAAKSAKEFGATGIGLVRTERMFNAIDRLPVMVDMILAKSAKKRDDVLQKLAVMQREDFKTIFLIMAPLPVTVRLLDPPLHEFLPGEVELIEKIRKTTDGAELTLLKKVLIVVRDLQEANSMLGHRGVRLGTTNPEIYKMQLRAILEASADCEEEGVAVTPEIMVPQVVTRKEIKPVLGYVKKIVKSIKKERGITVKFTFGTMIETVRACLRAGELAKTAQFFSFGTNDLSQATFSFDRESAENKFLPFYNENGYLNDNPFGTLDVNGVGELMQMAVERGRKTNPNLKIGICGEHGGEPRSIAFCHSIGLDYVSCSPPRIPIARLAAAHAALKDKK